LRVFKDEKEEGILEEVSKVQDVALKGEHHEDDEWKEETKYKCPNETFRKRTIDRDI